MDTVDVEFQEEKPVERGKSKKWLRLLAYGLLLYVFFLGISNLRLLVTEGSSMAPTYTPGDIVLCARSTSPPKSGDVVLVRHEGALVLKRVTYVAGETVQHTSWYFPNHSSYGISYELHFGDEMYWGSNVVPEGYVFVEGDNPSASHDSRYEDFGLVPIEDIWGTVTFTVYDQKG